MQVFARPSFASLPAGVCFGGTLLADATAFVVERGNRAHLITNWHVVTGRRPDNGAVLSSTGGVPDELVVLHNKKGALGSWIPKVHPLYDETKEPRWLEHPRYGRRVDVVALELSDRDGIDVHAYDLSAPGPGVAVGVAGGLSIIGFPFGVRGGGAMGVWVQGTVATEPSHDLDDLPCFLVDSRTRPGQSGSPVVVYHHAGGAVPMQDGYVSIFVGPVEQFVGVYSGRISDQSDLGFVWKASAVQEIVDNGVPGSV